MALAKAPDAVGIDGQDSRRERSRCATQLAESYLQLLAIGHGVRTQKLVHRNVRSEVG